MLEDYYLRYLDGDSQILLKAWNSIKNATRFNRMYDPSRALTKSDFESYALTGLKKAFDTFKINGGSKLTSWVITIINQQMLIGLNSHVKLNELLTLSKAEEFNENSNNLDRLFFNCKSTFEPSFISEDYRQYIVDDLLKKLYSINRLAYRVIKYKLENPELTNPMIANRFGLNYTTFYNYLELTKNIISDIIKNEPV